MLQNKKKCVNIFYIKSWSYVMWIKGDLHVHTRNCEDGVYSVEETIKRSKKYVDFIGFSGHAYYEENSGEAQYNEIVEARKKYPDLPIFHTAEQEFPIKRHVMFITVPENNEVALQKELINNFHRLNGIEGAEKACEELRYVKEKFGEEKTFMIFNHPSSPDVALEDFVKIANENDVFKVIACVDRGERRAKQTWDIGEEWDKLLMQGHRLFARNGSDFHHHFEDGGHDYYPGEFSQDYLWVKENTYEEIVKAYRTGNFYCSVGDCIKEPIFKCEKTEKQGLYNIELSFTCNEEMEQVDIISDGKCVYSTNDIKKDFKFNGLLEGKGYFRVRGWGKPKNRKYTEGQFTPQFLLNPLFI